MSHLGARRRLLAGIVGLLLASVLVTGCKFDGAYDLPLPGSPVSTDHSFQITADFSDVLNLVPKSPVKVNDVTVGEVTDVWRIGWHAGVRMRLQDDVKLPDNAIADIQQTSLLGEKYVALMPAPGQQPVGRLSNGDHLPLSATGRNPQVEEVLGALSFLLNGGGVAQLKTISTELNNVMDGRQQRIGHLLGQLNTMVATLDSQKSDIVRAMRAMNGLTATLNRERGTVGKAIDTIGPAVKVLADQRQQLMTMLHGLDRLGAVGTRVIRATKANTLADLRHLQPVLAKLNQAGESLPKAIELLVSFPFPKQARHVVHGDYANTAIAMDLSLGNIMMQLEKRDGGRKLPTRKLPRVPRLPGGSGGSGGNNLVPGAPNAPSVPDPGGLVSKGGGLLGGGLG
jgi:phospholipid/cholesterol/gamma-HCH transport system substrate-binding protein